MPIKTIANSPSARLVPRDELAFFSGFIRLFTFGEDRPIAYHHRTTVFRIMGSGGRGRAILWERWPPDLLRSFPKGTGITLMGGLCTDPSDFTEGEIIVTMRNCQPRRWWIPGPKMENTISFRGLTYWLEIEFDED